MRARRLSGSSRLTTRRMQTCCECGMHSLFFLRLYSVIRVSFAAHSFARVDFHRTTAANDPSPGQDLGDPADERPASISRNDVHPLPAGELASEIVRE